MSGQDLIGVIIVIVFVALMAGVAIYSKAKRTKAAAEKAEKDKAASKV